MRSPRAFGMPGRGVPGGARTGLAVAAMLASCSVAHAFNPGDFALLLIPYYVPVFLIVVVVEGSVYRSSVPLEGRRVFIASLVANMVGFPIPFLVGPHDALAPLGTTAAATAAEVLVVTLTNLTCAHRVSLLAIALVLNAATNLLPAWVVSAR